MTINLNTLQANNFKFEIQRLQNLTFFVKTINIPGLQASAIDVENSLTTLPVPGDKVKYSELEIEFIIDENLANYFEIFDWIKGLTFESDYNEYKNYIKTNDITSDAALIITNNSNIPIIQIDFEDIFPIVLGDIPLTVDNNEVITSSVTFRFLKWTYKKLS